MMLERWTSRHANVGEVERMGSVAAGLGLAVAGLTRHTLLGFTLVGLGAALVQRGIRGRCPLYGALGIDRANTPQLDDAPIDAVEQASMDSFPASDAPGRHSVS